MNTDQKGNSEDRARLIAFVRLKTPAPFFGLHLCGSVLIRG